MTEYTLIYNDISLLHLAVPNLICLIFFFFNISYGEKTHYWINGNTCGSFFFFQDACSLIKQGEIFKTIEVMQPSNIYENSWFTSVTEVINNDLLV